tara:strand:- start:895 stop:1236 length:342 start_codon:yes stop_codon:yes gene_type:complete
MTDKFIGAFIELVPNEEVEGVDFRFGWEFPDNFDPEHIELFKNLIAGIFGLMSSQDQEIIAIGEIVRKVSNFEDSIQIVSDSEIVFTPDDELLEQFQDSKVIDISKFMPKDED